MPAPAQDAADRHHGFAKEAQAGESGCFPLPRRLPRSRPEARAGCARCVPGPFGSHGRRFRRGACDVRAARRQDRHAVPCCAELWSVRSITQAPIVSSRSTRLRSSTTWRWAFAFSTRLRGAIFDGKRVVRGPGAREHRVQHRPLALRRETRRARGKDLQVLDRHHFRSLFLPFLSEADVVRSTGLTRPRRLRIRSSGGLMSLGAGAKFNAPAPVFPLLER